MSQSEEKSTIVPPRYPPTAPGRDISVYQDRARAASRLQREARAAAKEIVDGYTVQPTGPGGIGWEIIPPPKAGGPMWYLKDRESAIAAIPRHKAKYQETA